MAYHPKVLARSKDQLMEAGLVHYAYGHGSSGFKP
jgi:hypothetical protein